MSDSREMDVEFFSNCFGIQLRDVSLDSSLTFQPIRVYVSMSFMNVPTISQNDIVLISSFSWFTTIHPWAIRTCRFSRAIPLATRSALDNSYFISMKSRRKECAYRENFHRALSATNALIIQDVPELFCTALIIYVKLLFQKSHLSYKKVRRYGFLLRLKSK